MLEYILWTALYVLLIVIPLILVVAYYTYAERKVIGYMQDRIGPNRVGSFGLLQPIFDALKLFLKEIIVPTNSNRYLFFIAPILAFAPAYAAWAVIPFSKRCSIVRYEFRASIYISNDILFSIWDCNCRMGI